MGNNIIYLNEVNKSELSAPYVQICGVRMIGYQLEVIALSDKRLVELVVNGKLCCRQKSENGEFDFFIDALSGKVEIKAVSVSEPELFDVINIEL